MIGVLEEMMAKMQAMMKIDRAIRRQYTKLYDRDSPLDSIHSHLSPIQQRSMFKVWSEMDELPDYSEVADKAEHALSVAIRSFKTTLPDNE